MTEPTRDVDLSDLSSPPASGEGAEGQAPDEMTARQHSARFSIVEEPAGASEPASASPQEAPAPDAPVTVPSPPSGAG